MNALTHVRGQEAEDVPDAGEVRAGRRRSARRRSGPCSGFRATHWPKEQAQPLLDVAAGRRSARRPSADRTSPALLDALEFADALAAPAAAPIRRKRVRAELGELGVRVIRLGTLLERMSFDKDVIVVRAGKPVEFVFENTDLMPHNFVIAQPGALEEIGLMAEANAPAARRSPRRQFVPKSDKVLLGSKLLQPREIAEAQLHRADAAGRLSVCLHVSRPLAADVRRAVRRRGPRRLPGQPRGVPRREPAADQGRRC